MAAIKKLVKEEWEREREKAQKNSGNEWNSADNFGHAEASGFAELWKKASLLKSGPSGLPIAILYDAKDEFERKRNCSMDGWSDKSLFVS